MFVKAKSRERQEARRLRRDEGRSIKSIAKALSVSQASVSVWVRDVELTPEQREQLDRARDPARARGNARSVARARHARVRFQLEGRERARNGDPLHLMGCMLYWAEGAKSRNAVAFVNSDPFMVSTFLRFLRECYGVQDEQVALVCNCFVNNGLSLEEIQDWWLRTLRLPRSSLRKPVVNRPSSAGSASRRTLVYGTVRITVCSTRIVQSIYGAIQEYAGMDRPEWVDLTEPGRRPRAAPPAP
jgi:transposase-like protein